MLIVLSRLATIAAVTLLLAAGIDAYRASPDDAGNEDAEICTVHRSLLEEQISAGLPAWQQERMRRELPDCGSLPRGFWWRGRITRSLTCLLAALAAFAFASITVMAERAARSAEG